jgi:hypothetical protein
MSAGAGARNRPECDSNFLAASVIDANPGGWAADPIDTPQGGARHIGAHGSGSLWSNTPMRTSPFSAPFAPPST